MQYNYSTGESQSSDSTIYSREPTKTVLQDTSSTTITSKTATKNSSKPSSMSSAEITSPSSIRSIYPPTVPTITVQSPPTDLGPTQLPASSNLSEGSRVTIGVSVILCAVLLAALGCTIFIRRRKLWRTKRTEKACGVEESKPVDEKTIAHPQVAELASHHSMQIFNVQRIQKQHPLHLNPYSPTELEA